MNLLKKNTDPIIVFIPRQPFDGYEFTIELTNERNNNFETIDGVVTINENETYSITLATFPIGKENDKLAFVIYNEVEPIAYGKVMIVGENGFKPTTKYYE